MAARVLILTASIGAGHDVPAEVLADDLRELGAEIEIVDGLAVMGAIVERAVMGSSTFDSAVGNLHFDLVYALASRTPPGRWLAGALGLAFGARRLRARIAASAPDIVVSTYPGTTEILGRLRTMGRLRTPLASAITDLAALRFWAHPGVDLHLLTHRESEAEVRAIAGPHTRIETVRGLNPRGFADAPTRADARAGLDLPADVPVVLVSGGGWGVGDVEGALGAALAQDPDLHALVLCGTNEKLRTRLTAAHPESRVRTLGFTDRMPELMAAADVLIHSTAGLTVLEAAICGCHCISYGWGRGHIRINNRAFERFGLATVARTREQLASRLREALAHPRPRDESWLALPTAAEIVLASLGEPPARSDAGAHHAAGH